MRKKSAESVQIVGKIQEMKALQYSLKKKIGMNTKRSDDIKTST